MKKVLTVIGTRPEAIKLAPVIKALEERAGDIESIVCSTAQHREMLDQVLKLFDISPDYDLDVMKERQTPTIVASVVLAELDKILQIERPDWVLVQGDTTTVMAASIAAFYRRVRVGHVEAGLRTHDKWQPFPEEINRRIAGVVADFHFAPTEKARQNLLEENVSDRSILVTGNTVIDALLRVSPLPLTSSTMSELEAAGLSSLSATNGKGQRILLVTAHRRENHGRPLEEICGALKNLALRYGERIMIVYPVHLNPLVQEPVHRILGGLPNVVLAPPLGYQALVYVLRRTSLVLTDSGGLQEEAPGLGIPVLVLRETTERPEGIESGTVKLVGTNGLRILSETCRLLDNHSLYDSMATAFNPYGDGMASTRIVDAIIENEYVDARNAGPSES